MSAHSHEHEERLATLLGGEGRPDEPGVARLLADCALCRERWEALRGVVARVGEAGRERGELLAGLERRGPAPGEDRIAPTLARLANREPHRRARPRWPLLTLAAAALLVLGAWLGGRFAGRAGDAGDGAAPNWLGSPGLQLRAPRGEVTSFERFEWTYHGQAEGYALRIYAAEGEDRGGLLHASEKWTETTWRPDAELLARLGARIYWELDVLDAFGSSLASDSALAWLSPR